MIFRSEKPLALFLSAVFIAFLCGCDSSEQVAMQSSVYPEPASSAQTQDKKTNDEQAQKVFDHVIENLRYSRYWHEAPDIGDGYEEGKQISALIFWTKADRQSKVGLCSPDLERCFATWGDQIRPEMEQMLIDRSLTAKAAFESFVEDGIDVNAIKIVPQIIQPPPGTVPPTAKLNPSVPGISSVLDVQSLPKPKRLSLTDFEFVEKTITLPPLGLPTSISSRAVPKEAASEAKKVKQNYTCWGEGKRPRGCTGAVVFAYYHESDSTWPVLRTCSSSCPPMFQGESIQFLRRGSWGWEAYGGGQTSSPKEEVIRLKQKIKQAEMFRFQIP